MTSEPVPIHEDAESPTSGSVQRIGRVAGPLAAIALYALLSWSSGLNAESRATAAIGTLMAIWWMTEALPLAVTSLLPLVLFPLAGVLTMEEAAAPYAEKNVYLFFGGFLIALAVERWNLHRRIALLTVLRVGTRPDRLIGGIMLATAGVSMWISNTATAAMMLPIGMSLVTLLGEHLREAAHRDGHSEAGAAQSTQAFATCIMLGIAYSASIGGLGTPVGTPTNIALTGFAHKRDIAIGFGSWMVLAIPLVLVFLGLTWLLLTKWLFPIGARDLPGGHELIRAELDKLGPLSRGEKIALGVFLATGSAWVLREPAKSLMLWVVAPEQLAGLPASLAPAVKEVQRIVARLDDALIAMVGAIALFLLPVDRRRGVYALDWQTAAKMPWGILLLFGGGFAFTAAMTKSGLTEAIGEQLATLRGMPACVIVLASVAAVIFTTELTSNTPTILAFLPILYSVALGVDIHPLMLLVPATLAASCAFMLPVGTPPNAIVFATGRVTIGQMVRAGWWLNLIGVGLITATMYTLGKWTFQLP